MAGHSVGRAGVLVPPSLPTICETTLSWLGSDFENSLQKLGLDNYDENSCGKLQDYEDQCFSVKSGEESEFSGIQPLPPCSDDTSPSERSHFNKVVKKNLHHMLNFEDANRPKPFPSDTIKSNHENSDTKDFTEEDFNEIFQLLDSKMMEGNINLMKGEGDSSMLQKLKIIRNWQIEHQEKLQQHQEKELETVNQNESLQIQNDSLLNKRRDTSNNDGGAKNTSSPEEFDEKPIKVQVPNSFETLVEIELKKANNNNEKSDAKPTTSKPKHKFLRRGQGIARFNGPPKKPPKKSKTAAKQSNNKMSLKPPSGNVFPKNKSVPKSKFSGSKLIEKLCLKPEIKENVFKPINTNEVQRIADRDASQECDSGAPELKSDDDLEEFELLEKYAEEDASFFSEQSLIVSVLKEKKKKDDVFSGQKSLRERVRERREAREKDLNIKVPKPVYPQQMSKAVQEKMMANNLEEATFDKNQLERSNQEKKDIPKIMRRKVVSLIKKEKLPVENGENAMENFIRKLAISTPKQENNPTSDEDYSSEKEVDEFDDDKTWEAVNFSLQNGFDFGSDGKSDSTGNNPQEYKSSDYVEPENEDVENGVRDIDSAASGNGVIDANGRRLSLSPPPPPTTLMQKLFPGLKVPNSQKNCPVKDSSPSIEPTEKNEDSSKNDTSASALKEKLNELETEIAKFRSENKRLEELTSEREKNLKTLANEMHEFQRQKDEELNRLDEHKKTEIKKLKKERKLFEEHVMKTKALPSKEEREEIHNLKEELESLRSDMKTKEQRWNSATSRLRSQVQRLEEDNSDLKSQIKEIEKQRLKDMNDIRMQSTTSVCAKPSVWKAINEIVDSVALPKDVQNNPAISKAAKQDQAKDKKRKPVNVKKSPLGNNHLTNQNSPTLPNKFSPKKSLDKESPENKPPTKVERVLKNGNKIIEFANGTQKEISSDGKYVEIKFANGDIKKTLPDGTIVYFYQENGTTHTTQPDGMQVLEFPNKQVEHHFLDGTKQISFPDGTVKYLHTDGTEQTVFADGTEMHASTSGDKTIVFANGQREIHTSSFKRREYPDGTSKTVYEDGRQETRYASGRLRVKDSHGNIIVDRMT